jgi:hypothetical protein
VVRAGIGKFLFASITIPILIEATSDYFSSVSKTIKQVLADTKRVAEFLSSKYAAIFRTAPADSPLNSLLIDHYRLQLSSTFEADFESWWSGKSFLAEIIAARHGSDALYRTPSILLVYFLCIIRSDAREAR